METQVNDKYALCDAWAHGQDLREPFDYEIISTGQTVLLRRLDMGDLLRLGVAEELDFMTKTLMTDEKAAGKAQEAVASAIMKADNFQRMERMINLVCVAGVIKPHLHMPPANESARQKGLIYADSVPFNDRMELFSVIFETGALTDFREEQEDGVGTVQHVTDVQLPADDITPDIRSEDAEGVLS